MTNDRRTAGEKYVGPALAAHLAAADMDGIRRELTWQRTAETGTASWLERVGLQATARDMYMRQKGTVLALGRFPCAEAVGMNDKRQVAEHCLRLGFTALGPTAATMPSPAAAIVWQSKRIGGLLNYGDDQLLTTLRGAAARPVEITRTADQIIARANQDYTGQMDVLAALPANAASAQQAAAEFNNAANDIMLPALHTGVLYLYGLNNQPN